MPKIYLDDPDFRLYCGDALETLRGMPDGVVHCALTSPPFYGLRDYGTGSWEGGDEGCDHAPVRGLQGQSEASQRADRTFTGAVPQRDVCSRCGARRVDQQIGLEPTPDMWVTRLVDVFREVRRVLRPDGTLWVEISSSYASGGTPASRSRQPERDPAYDSDDIEPQDSPDSGSAYLGRCDERLDETRIHPGRTLDTDQPLALDEHAPSTTSRDTSSEDSALEAAGAVPLVAPGSTTPASSPHSHSQLPTAEADPSTPCSSEPDAPASAHKPGYTNGTEQPASASHSPGMDASGTACLEFKPKDLIMQPFYLAEALRQDGWYLRQIIIWGKPNSMPESVRDRCTTAHSYILLLSKSRSYFFDAEAIAEPAEWAMWGTQTVPKYNGTASSSGWMEEKTKAERIELGNGRKNARSVWQIPTSGYAEAHFATWPPALVERIIKAGTSERGVCPECGAPWTRDVEVSYEKSPVHGEGSTIRKRNEGTEINGWAGEQMPRLAKVTSTLGWKPSCECHGHYEDIPEIVTIPGTEDTYTDTKRVYVMDADCPPPVPATVLDPFMGSGTTALVARRLGRRSIGIELNENYCEMAARRLQQLSLLADGAV